MKKISIILSISIMILAACGAVVAEKQVPELNNTSWTLTKLNGEDVLNSTEVWIIFEEGQISGNGGCNQFGGEATINSDGSISFGNIFSTLMFCEQDGISDQELSFFHTLDQAQTYHSENGDLIMSDESNQSILEFTTREIVVKLGNTNEKT